MNSALVVVATLVGSFVSSAEEVRPRRPVHTYSIVARDASTGQLGVAVQSHWFSVGSNVSWAEAGVGAVATQSFIDPAYGMLGLDLMRAGRSAPNALAGLVAADGGRDVRQVAMIDAEGRVDAWTGDKRKVSTSMSFPGKADSRGSWRKALVTTCPPGRPMEDGSPTARSGRVTFGSGVLPRRAAKRSS